MNSRIATVAMIAAICGWPAKAQYLTSTVAVGTSPEGIAVNPATDKIYVTNLLRASVTVIDGATNTTLTLAAGAYPTAIAVNSVTNKIYVANFLDNSVTVIDGITAAISTVAVGSSPQAIAVNSVTNKIYVANFLGGTVTVIDGATNTTSTIAVGPAPIGFAVNQVTNKIYVANEDESATATPDGNSSSSNSTSSNSPNGSVTVIDGATNTTSTVAAGTSVAEIAINPATNKIYVTNYMTSNVTVIDGATATTSTVAVGSDPNAIAVNPVTNKIYVANAGSENVTVIDGATTATYTVAESPGSSPTAIAVNPATNKIYAANDLSVIVIDGATGTTTTIPTQAGPSFIAVNQVTNTIYVGGSQSSNITVITEPLAFTLTASPSAALVATGRTAVFNAMAGGSPVPTYQWTLNGSTTIPGAATTTDPILMITGATSVDVGTLTCTATNSAGAVSTSATLAVTTTTSPGYLTNLSGRGLVGSGATNALFGGFGISGTGTKQLLIRGMGPSLGPGGPFYVADALQSTQLTLYNSLSVAIDQNTGWGGTAALMAADSLTGAYAPIATTSLDSMLYLPVATGSGSASVGGVSGATGDAVIELYDADPPPLAAKLTNVSVRAPVGTGNDILFVGFVIGGTTDETILIRGIGPSLAMSPFNLTGVLAQPVVTLFAGNTPIYANAVWGGDPVLAGVESTVGAYPIPTNSADSLLLVTLPPATYSAQISGVNNTTGIAAVEIYEVP